MRDLDRSVHKTIQRVTEDLEKFKFNTALAALMELSNEMGRTWESGSVSSESWAGAVERLLLLLAPMAPHISEELWERTGHDFSIHNQALPSWDPELATDEVITLVVQVNGRLRDRLEVPVSISEDAAKEGRPVQPARRRPHGGQAGRAGDLRARQAGQRGWRGSQAQAYCRRKSLLRILLARFLFAVSRRYEDPDRQQCSEHNGRQRGFQPPVRHSLRP